MKIFLHYYENLHYHIAENPGIFGPFPLISLGLKWKHFSTLAVTVHLKIPRSHLNELSLVICGYRDGLPQFSVMDLYFFHMHRAERKGSMEKNSLATV